MKSVCVDAVSGKDSTSYRNDSLTDSHNLNVSKHRQSIILQRDVLHSVLFTNSALNQLKHSTHAWLSAMLLLASLSNMFQSSSISLSCA